MNSVIAPFNPILACFQCKRSNHVKVWLNMQAPWQFFHKVLQPLEDILDCHSGNRYTTDYQRVAWYNPSDVYLTTRINSLYVHFHSPSQVAPRTLWKSTILKSYSVSPIVIVLRSNVLGYVFYILFLYLFFLLVGSHVLWSSFNHRKSNCLETLHTLWTL